MDTGVTTTTIGGKDPGMALNEIIMTNKLTPKWDMQDSSDNPQTKCFIWTLTLEDYTSMGTGPNKKVAKKEAAAKMLQMIPEEWKQKEVKVKKGKKRGAGENGDNSGEPKAKKKAEEGEGDGKIVIKADNPISCLYEYAHKKKIAAPEFNIVSGEENYTMEVKIDGKVFRASGDGKKTAKSAVAKEAWNSIWEELCV